MPKSSVTKRARTAKKQGKSPSTQAGEFVREEIDAVRRGEHGVRSAKQAIAIGLSKARRAGVELKPPSKGKTSQKTRRSAERDYAVGHGASPKRAPSRKRSEASMKALKREPTATVSTDELSKQTKGAAKRRSASDRSAAARKASATKGRSGRSAAAKKAARTRRSQAS